VRRTCPCRRAAAAAAAALFRLRLPLAPSGAAVAVVVAVVVAGVGQSLVGGQEDIEVLAVDGKEWRQGRVVSQNVPSTSTSTSTKHTQEQGGGMVRCDAIDQNIKSRPARRLAFIPRSAWRTAGGGSGREQQHAAVCCCWTAVGHVEYARER